MSSLNWVPLSVPYADMNHSPALQTPQRHDHGDDDSRVGPEKWVPEAIAQQEEHIRRSTACQGVRGRSHAFRTFGVPSPDGTIAQSATYQACIVCGVTETDADYQTRLAALHPRHDS